MEKLFKLSFLQFFQFLTLKLFKLSILKLFQLSILKIIWTFEVPKIISTFDPNII